MNWHYFWLLFTMIIASTVVAFGGQIVATDYLRRPDEERSGCGRLEVLLVQIIAYAMFSLIVVVLAGAIVAVCATKPGRHLTRAPILQEETVSIVESSHEQSTSILANENSR